MAIQGIASNLLGTVSAGTDQDVASPDALGREDFLTLLVEQLKHQDPMNPMQSVEFTGQLAQFSSLEQLFGLNKTLTTIQTAIAAQGGENELDYIGKTVLATNDTLSVTDGNVDAGAYNLGGTADVRIYVYDQWDSLVRTMDVGTKAAGEHTLQWDGRDNKGSLVADGNYHFELDARNGNGLSVPYTSYLSGQVTGVTYKGDTAYLTVGGQTITPEQISEVRL